MEKYNILLADDHSLIRQGLTFVIEDLEWNTELFQASTLQQVLELIQVNPFDLAVIDAQFPDGSSHTILKQIKAACPNIKILIFTGLDEKANALKYIMAGADGFLSKLSNEEEIAAVLEKIKTEGKYLSPITQELMLNAMIHPTTVNLLDTLTERELEIAKLYAGGMGNLEIANHLDLKQNTVSTQKKRIFEKLNVENILELAELFKQ